jgi:metal-sulfur cluster biosynthetic enzyme
MRHQESETVTEQAPSDVERGDKPGLEQQIWAALSEVVDPELHMDIVTLGLVYGVKTEGTRGEVEMTLTSPGCPYGPHLIYAVDHAVRQVEGVEDVDVEVVWEPPWGPERMSEEARLELGFDV